MQIIRRIILALVLIAGFGPAIAQVPPPVPALPDVERRTAYTIATSQCSCTVNMALYGDSTDYQNWLEVWLNGVNIAFNDPNKGWTITSPTGPIGNIARPITDGVLTFNSAQTGTVQIVGARRPRRVSQFNENNGVSARNLNQVITDIVAMLREVWDKINDVTGRAIVGQPGETLPPLPSAASRVGQFLCFNSSGQPTTCAATSGTGTIQGGTGILLSGTNPTVISTNLTAGTGINITGSTITNTGVGYGATHVLTASYTLTTTDCFKTVEISGGFFTFTLPAASGFAEGCWIIVKNGDSWSGGRGKALSGFPSDFTNGQGILWPTQVGAVQVQAGAWTALARPGRAKLPSGALTIFTDFTHGTDTPGATDGLANGTSAFRSLQEAMYTGCNEFEFNSLPQTLLTYFMAAATTDTGGVHYACSNIPGSQGGSYIEITGGTGATISTTNTDSIDIVTGATVSVFGITLASSGTVPTTTRPADCLRADYGGHVFMLALTFSVCAGSDMAAENGGIILVQAGNYTVQGSANSHFFASTGGSISTDYIAVTQSATIAANVTMLTAFAIGGRGGIISVPSWTSISPGGFTVTGTKTAVQGSGAIYTGAGTSACNNSYFPGTVNATVAAPFCN